MTATRRGRRAAARTRRRGRTEALRPWTAKESPAAKAGPIAFDAADLVALWRAVSGSTRNPHVQKGERVKGRKNAVGVNYGGERIEIVSRLFGVLDKGDVAKIRYVVNGWKQYHAAPKAKRYKQMRAIKDPALKAKAMEWIDGGAKWQD